MDKVVAERWSLVWVTCVRLGMLERIDVSHVPTGLWRMRQSLIPISPAASKTFTSCLLVSPV
jgi:hypothetical protein